ncbi:SafA/ExsA family spore coat assembly protein [Bacillus timonensis]|nr:SafA/ExsA family spore coat assembly protein [Bacillus timonensis]
MKIHIVQKGDTLWKIAKKYGVNFEELKQMNSQLSNPDMIMPGMKIKVPSGSVPVKKESQVQAGQSKEYVKKEAKINMAPKKEMQKVEHPFKDLAPKPTPVVKGEEEKAKEKVAPMKEKAAPMKEKVAPSKEEKIAPFEPKMPQMKQPLENNYNVPNIPQMPNNMPQMPNNLPNMPNLPNIPQAPSNVLPGVMEEEEPEVVSPVEDEMPTQQQMDPYCVPVTPVMPGYGWCVGGPGGFPTPPYPQGGYPAAMQPQGYPQAISPEMMDDDDDMDGFPSQGYPQMAQPMMPQGYPQQMPFGQPMPGYGMNPYAAPFNQGGFPAGGAFPPYAPQQGASPAVDDDDDEMPDIGPMQQAPYGMPLMPQPMAPYGQMPPTGYGLPSQAPSKPNSGEDCGCEEGTPMAGQPFGMPMSPGPFGAYPQHPYPGMQQGYPQHPYHGMQQGGYPQQPYQGMPPGGYQQQPFHGMPPQGQYGGFPQQGYGAHQPQPGFPMMGGYPNSGGQQQMPFNPMFTMPDFDDDDED